MKKIREVLEFEVQETSDGKRLDKFLSEAHPELSRTYIKRLIQEGYVRVEGEVTTKPSHKVHSGQRLSLEVPEPEPLEIKPEKIPIEVLYEDDDLAVIIKPCGLIVHPSPGYTSGTLVNALLYHFGRLSSIGGYERPGIVHRLDKNTAGLMVVARNDLAHRELSRQFAQRKVKKVYNALVSGLVREEGGLIDLPLGRHPADRKRFAVRSDRSREAITEFRTLERFERVKVTLLELNLLTGRTHQIRVHLSHLGYPILGDTVYGFKGKSLPRDVLGLMGDCHMLVAVHLGFTHPSTGEYLDFRINHPQPFRAVLERIRKLNGSLC